jgi:hypothetical protein
VKPLIDGGPQMGSIDEGSTMNLGDGIDNLRSGHTGRSSSWDRTGGNKDFMEIAPGESIVAADIEGPGKITHLWFTGHGGSPSKRREVQPSGSGL